MAALLSCLAVRAQDAVGVFAGQTDVGTVLHPGSATYDEKTQRYTVAGSGANMWFGEDDFHFVWVKLSVNDVSIAADIDIENKGDAHRKAVLMIRQNLDPDSAYADAAVHGDGLTSLQYREVKGADTHEIESDVSGPTRVELVKQEDSFYLLVAKNGEKLRFAGGSAVVKMQAPFYIGIGVCAHNKDAVLEAAFDRVKINTAPPRHSQSSSTVETILLSTDARVGYVSRKRITNAGWSADGHALHFDENGHPQETAFTPLATAAAVGQPITGKSVPSQAVPSAEFNNTQPVVSPDGKYEVFLSYPAEADALPERGPVSLCVMSLADHQIKTLANFIGGAGSLGERPWSPDGRRIVFVSYQELR